MMHPHTHKHAGVEREQVAVSAQGIVRMNIVWVSRRSFETLNYDKLIPMQRQRLLDDAEEEAIVMALQRLVLDWNKASCM
jgi:hypothetical protein